MEGMVHVGLEGGQGVAKSKEHHSWLVEPKGGGEGCFPTVFRSDEDVVISPLDVKFGEDFAILEFVYQFGYEG